jgi:hypothetical protein
MNWHGMDAISEAFRRTKYALIEPFDFWKWLKLGIIIFLIGGGGSNFIGNIPSGGDHQYPDLDNGRYNRVIDDQSIGPILEQISQFLQEYGIYFLIILGALVFIILLFAYISCLMEFVLVESLVTNIVSFWAYSRQYMRAGFNLLIIRLILGLVFLFLLIITVLPPFLVLFRLPDTSSIVFVLISILWFFAVVFILAIINSIIHSFINLSIPLSMYHNIGITRAFINILGAFKADWKQIMVYWIVRFFLGLLVGIIVCIIALIIFLILFLVALIPFLILLLIMTGVGLGFGDVLVWVVMIPYVMVTMLVFFIFILIVSVPASVFHKYYLLTFLQLWYPDAKIPLFNQKSE